MSYSINKLKSNVLFTSTDFVFSNFTYKKVFTALLRHGVSIMLFKTELPIINDYTICRKLYR